jgi:hypothetical protein
MKEPVSGLSTLIACRTASKRGYRRLHCFLSGVILRVVALIVRFRLIYVRGDKLRHVPDCGDRLDWRWVAPSYPPAISFCSFVNHSYERRSPSSSSQPFWIVEIRTTAQGSTAPNSPIRSIRNAANRCYLNFLAERLFASDTSGPVPSYAERSIRRTQESQRVLYKPCSCLRHGRLRGRHRAQLERRQHKHYC